MCYAKPGPRCSNHTAHDLTVASKALGAAKQSLHAQPSLEAMDVYKRAEADHQRCQEAWLASPAGIAELRQAAEADEREGRTDEAVATRAKADKNEASRAEALRRYHAIGRNAENTYWDAQSKGTDPAVLRDLAFDAAQTEKVRARVATNPSTPADALEHLARNGFEEGVARDRSCPEHLLLKFAGSDDWYLRSLVATNGGATVRVTDLLAHDRNREVRQDLVTNASLSPATQLRLAKDRSKAVRAKLASQRHLVPATYIALAEDTDYAVSYALRHNSAAPHEALGLLNPAEVEALIRYEKMERGLRLEN